MQPLTSSPEKTYTLPPLILHPFTDLNGPSKLVESSRASLMLQGLLPSGELSADDLERTLLEGRYCEVRMLFYVGKDIRRWLEQCVEFVDREDELHGRGITCRSFAAMLVDDPPKPVREKLRKWGVADYKAIFSRALGLNAIFQKAPEREALADGFVRDYYRYADHMFACEQRMAQYAEIRSAVFHFDLFASGEYSRMLEREWEADLDLDRP